VFWWVSYYRSHSLLASVHLLNYYPTAPRQGYPGSPIKEKFRKDGSATTSPSTTHTKINGRFQNTGKDPEMANAQLFYMDQFWGKLGHDAPSLAANTYEGHVWNIQVDGKVVKTWTIATKDGTEQIFKI
jgi:hypothetical protein